MFFGEKLRELRLEYAKQGLRNFALTMDMPPSDYYRIEAGFEDYPRNIKWFDNLLKKLELPSDFNDNFEFIRLWKEPFIMQKMSECGMIAHATRRIKEGEEGFTSDKDGYNTRPATPVECMGLTDFINNHVREHNKKADEYNNGFQRETS